MKTVLSFLLGLADLELTKTDTQVVGVGDKLCFGNLIKMWNYNQLPSGLTFVSADATQGSYNVHGLWTIGV
ncbi:MAG: hypothetical protein R2798_06145 [Chitinophagales bacterium]